MDLRILSLCSGIGGIDLGLKLALPCRTVSYCEREAYAIQILASRMEEGWLDQAPVWTNLQSFPSSLFSGHVDLCIAGFPCQPASVAGKRLGTNDDRWLWPDVFRVTRNCGASALFIENVPGIITVNGGGAFKEIVNDIASIGWDCRWGIFSARDVGAPHIRKRFFLLAYSGQFRLQTWLSQNPGQWEISPTLRGSDPFPPGPDGDWKDIIPEFKPCIRGVADGYSPQLDRLRACGNGVVPVVVAHAFITLAKAGRLI